MFDTSFPEMVVIFVIALLVLGPERLPRVARTVGLWVGRARATFARMRTELEREVNFQELQDAQRELRQSLSASEKAISESVKPIVDAVEAVPRDIAKGSPAAAAPIAEDEHATPAAESGRADDPEENTHDSSKQAAP